MSLALIFSEVTKRRSSIAGLELDVTISENHNLPSVVTNHPVEDGSTVSDHIVIEPRTLTVQGLVSNTPVQIGGGTNNAIKDTFDELIRIRNARELFTVSTGLDVYSNMFFTNIDIPRDATTGQSLVWTATMQEIQVVASQLVAIQRSRVNSAFSDTAGSRVDRGKQTPTGATPADVNARVSSVLSKLLKGAGI